jgi:carbamoyl-phosphate synthase large subunit
MTKISIAVSGIDYLNDHAAGFGIARSLKRNTMFDSDITALGYSERGDINPVRESCYDHYGALPDPAVEPHKLLQHLEAVKGRLGLDLLIPTKQWEIPFYIRKSRELERMGIRTYLPTPKQYRLCSRSCLAETALLMDVELPSQMAVKTPQQLIKATMQIGLPVMIKGNFQREHKAESLEEAMHYFRHIGRKSGYPVVVQRYVKGEKVNVAVVADGYGGVSGLFALRNLKRRTGASEWRGEKITHQSLEEAVRRFVDRTSWQGAMELECRIDEGKIHLLEVIPTFPDWVDIAASSGVNLPGLMVRTALCKPTLDKDDNYKVLHSPMRLPLTLYPEQNTVR